MPRVKASSALKKMSILYVEDEDFVRESFTNLLKRSIKTVHIAKDGQEGLEIYKEHHIDIVISDINMPKMNGLEMAKNIKEINTESVIVFTTAFGDNEYLQKSIDIGVDGYLIKPIDINKVFLKLNTLAKTINSKNEVDRYTNLLKVILDEQREGILLFDENLDIKMYNHSFQQMYAKTTTKVIESIDDIFEFCKEIDTDCRINKTWFENIDDNKKELVLMCKRDNKKEKYYQTVTKKVKDYIVFSVTDITELKSESAKLKAESITDKLTGLYNRKIIEIKQDEFLKQELYMIILDIDDFKIINDTHGHLIGDEVLKVLAKIVKSAIRKNDIAIRWGGEEFVVLLQNIPNIDTAKNIAENMRKHISNTRVDKVGNFSCSFGVSSHFIKNSDDLDILFQKADDLLYKAKKAGKNRVEI